MSGAVGLDIAHEIGRYLGEGGPRAGGFGNSDLASVGAFEHFGGGLGEIFSKVGDGTSGAVAETFSVVYATQTGRDQGTLEGKGIRRQGRLPYGKSR